MPYWFDRIDIVPLNSRTVEQCNIYTVYRLFGNNRDEVDEMPVATISEICRSDIIFTSLLLFDFYINKSWKDKRSMYIEGF